MSPRVAFMSLGVALFLLASPTRAEWASVQNEWEPYGPMSDEIARWFQTLTGKFGKCCTTADGHPTKERKDINGTWAIMRGSWVLVPPDVILYVRNPTGVPVLWHDKKGNIRCFVPGPEY